MLTRIAVLFSLTWAVASQQPTPETGTLPSAWLTGGPDCAAVPKWQVHRYNPTFYILRESGCIHYEKPFLYLILGSERALLVDTGAGEGNATSAIREIIGALPLVVAHSHAHGDHVSGDAAFRKMDGVTFVAPTVEALQKFFGIARWPEDAGTIDLGGRIVDVIPIPGHQAAHVAYYDRRTGILLTGDHLYPGRLYVSDFAAYLASTRRLVDFTTSRPVAHILGCHIEQSATPFVDYPVGTKYQPDEHPLAMGRGQLLELLAGLEAMQGKPARSYFRDFTIWPREPRPAK